MKKDSSWNSAGDRRFVRRFKEHWVDVAVAFGAGALIVLTGFLLV